MSLGRPYAIRSIYVQLHLCTLSINTMYWSLVQIRLHMFTCHFWFWCLHIRVHVFFFTIIFYCIFQYIYVKIFVSGNGGWVCSLLFECVYFCIYLCICCCINLFWGVLMSVNESTIWCVCIKFLFLFINYSY